MTSHLAIERARAALDIAAASPAGGVSDFARKALILATAHKAGEHPAAVAEHLFGDAGLRLVRKAAADTIDSTSGLGGPGGADASFARATRAASVLGRLNYRPAPFNVSLPWMSAGAAGDFFGEGQPVSVAAPTSAAVDLPHLRCSSLVAVSGELLKHGAAAAAVFDRDLRDGVAQAVDRRLLDPTSGAVARVRPASVTYDAASHSAAGAESADDVSEVFQILLAELADVGSAMLDAVFIMPPRVAIAIAGLRDTGGRAFPTLGARGGEVMGLPVLVSAGAPADTIIALDGSELLLADELEADVHVSRSAMLDHSEALDGSARVSLFQADAVGLLATRWINWTMRNPAVAYAHSLALPLPESSTA